MNECYQNTIGIIHMATIHIINIQYLKNLDRLYFYFPSLVFIFAGE